MDIHNLIILIKKVIGLIDEPAEELLKRILEEKSGRIINFRKRTLLVHQTIFLNDQMNMIQ